MNKLDITNTNYYSLTALCLSDKTKQCGKSPIQKWKCICECGAIVYATAGELRCGAVRSCGCRRRNYRNRPHTWDAQLHEYYTQYQYSAASRKLSFELSKEDFEKLITQHCVYCDREPRATLKKFNKSKNIILRKNGIDRIDSSLGYTPENCITCCIVCNRAKNNMDKNTFVEWITKVYNNYIGKNHAQ